MLGAAAVLVILFFIVFNNAELALRLFVLIFGAAAAVYWCIYFYSISYELSENELVATSGIFIKKVRKIALSDIVLEMRISIGKMFLATILRTSGGSVVVFGKLQLTL